MFFQSAHMLSDERQREVVRRRRDYHDTIAGHIERARAAVKALQAAIGM